MTDINKIARAFQDIKSQIAGTDKRHNNLYIELRRSLYHNKSSYALAESLSRRLKKDEGIIFMSSSYGDFTGNIPIEAEMHIFQKDLDKYNLALTCIYQKSNESGITVAVFIIVHRDIDKALEYKDRINEALGLNLQKPTALLVKTFIKITENLGKDINLEKLVASCQLLQQDEVYCVSMNIFTFYQIDPNQFSSIMDSLDFNIQPLVNPSNDPNTPIEYRQYEDLVGFLLSRTSKGIEWGLANIETVLRVCNTAEEDLLKSTTKNTLQ